MKSTKLSLENLRIIDPIKKKSTMSVRTDKSTTIVSANLNGFFNHGNSVKRTLDAFHSLRVTDIFVFTETKDSYDKESSLAQFVQENPEYVLFEEKSQLRRGYAGVSVLLRASSLQERTEVDDVRLQNKKCTENKFVGRISLREFSELNDWSIREYNSLMQITKEKSAEETTKETDDSKHIVTMEALNERLISSRDCLCNNKKDTEISSTISYNFLREFTGRILILQFTHFILLSVYTLNSGRFLKKLGLRTHIFDIYLKCLILQLRERYGRPIILTGDLNIIVDERDIWNPKKNKRLAGFTHEERNSFAALLEETKLVDSFRYLHGNDVKYTFFSSKYVPARVENKGFRLDYAFVTPELCEHVVESDVLDDDETLGVISDHRPIVLKIKLA